MDIYTTGAAICGGGVIFLLLVVFLIIVSGTPSKEAESDASWREQYIKNTDAEHVIHVTSFEGKVFFHQLGIKSEELKAVSIVLRKEGITLYDETSGRRPILIAPYTALRGVFLSQLGFQNVPYRLELHFHDDERWQFLHISTESLIQRDSSSLLQALDPLAEKPHGIHREEQFNSSWISEAYFSTRKLTGEWEYTESMMLCITPLYLIIAADGGELRHVIPVENIKQIKSLPNLANEAQPITQVILEDGTVSEMFIQANDLVMKMAFMAANRRHVPVIDIWEAADTRKKFAEDYEKLKRDEGA